LASALAPKGTYQTTPLSTCSQDSTVLQVVFQPAARKTLHRGNLPFVQFHMLRHAESSQTQLRPYRSVQYRTVQIFQLFLFSSITYRIRIEIQGGGGSNHILNTEKLRSDTIHRVPAHRRALSQNPRHKRRTCGTRRWVKPGAAWPGTAWPVERLPTTSWIRSADSPTAWVERPSRSFVQTPLRGNRCRAFTGE